MSTFAEESTIVMIAGSRVRSRISHTVTVVFFDPEAVASLLLPVDRIIPSAMNTMDRNTSTMESTSSEFFAKTVWSRAIRNQNSRNSKHRHTNTHIKIKNK